jgi:hypothetical protein
MTQACKKRRAVYISSESEDSSTDSDVEGNILSQKSSVTSISTCEHQSSYKRKTESLNASKIRMCGNVLRKLMDNKLGLLFREPVDPVLYGIPDYFDVIKNPMDLGTVKKKLTNSQYANLDEFAADVRLTFSNAMTYNPPGNQVHTVAEQLNGIFESEWKLVERKCRDRNLVNEQQAMKVIKIRAAVDSKSVIAKGVVSRSNSKPLIDRGSVPLSNSIAKKTLTDMLSSKVKIKFSVRSSEQSSSKDGSREGPFNHSLPAINESSNRSLPSIKENAKISRLQAPEHSSELIGKKSRSCNDTSTSPLGSSGQGYFTGEECYLQDEHLSPSRALRAAMLRSRFAGTIVKAQQKALLDHVIFQNYVVNFVDCN